MPDVLDVGLIWTLFYIDIGHARADQCWSRQK
jgi:hypothetical protein